MGYWSDYKPKGMSFREWANNKYTFENDDIKHTVIDAALVKRTTGYIACERLSKKDGVKYIYCLVVLIRWENGDNWNMMIKEVDETCGPYECECPKKIFKLLSPVRKLRAMGNSFKWSKNWRNKVVQYHKKCDVVQQITNGDILRFNKKIKFIGGTVADVFEVVNKVKNDYRIVDSNYYVILSKQFLKNNEFYINK